MKKESVKSIIGILVIILLFLITSYYTQEYSEHLKSSLNNNIFGMIIFIFIVAISIVLAPVSAAPLFPVASNIWGWILTGILGTVGWTIGAVIAFIIARKYGIPLIKKLISIKELEKFEKKIPKDHLFITLVILRMVIPFDGISYIFGLFTTMKLKDYTIATIIGLIPLTFLTAYVGTLSIEYQIAILIFGLVLLLIMYAINIIRKKSRKIW